MDCGSVRSTFVLRVFLALLAALVAAELVLHALPRLPAWYRASLPMDGIELDRPGILARTPVDQLPMPWIADSWDGPPAADVVEKGLVGPDVALDRERYPRVELPIDARGLPNPEALERAEVVLIGDSFMVGAAAAQPPGLVPRLAERLSASVYDLAVGGIGPHQEAWLLRTLGLELEPELVLWFFFGGNDLVDARLMRVRLEQGIRTLAEDEEYRAPPVLLLPDLVRVRLEGGEQRPDPVPPLAFHLADGGTHPFWFLPRHLFMLTMPIDVLRGHRGWQPTQDILRDARRRTEERGARFAVVYLPSKAQVYLPLVERDPERVHRMLTFDGVEPGPSPGELLEAMLANRGALEELLRAFCEDEGIPFFSATPHLEALAERGELGYLTCDTHWEVEGQGRSLEPLARFSRELLGR